MASRQTPEAETQGQETLLEFPCEFPVKVMGRDTDEFEKRVTAIILSHAQQCAGTEVTINRSGGGKFIGVTVTIEAHSKNQLDRMYQELADCEHVLVTL
ncbi:MAG: DUF493 domain-containing protein [Xanthomonadales bacterium]|nr:DUF493 domain-containing protein [Xanthomonadales bacterium]